MTSAQLKSYRALRVGDFIRQTDVAQRIREQAADAQLLVHDHPTSRSRGVRY